MMLRDACRYAAIFGLSLALGGCVASTLVQDFKNTFVESRDINLTESTYAATDMLAQQTRAHMTPVTPVRVAIITEASAPDEMTALGRQLANNIGARLVQLGYNVQSMPIPPAMVTPAAPVPLDVSNAPQPRQMGMKPGGGDALVTGTYTRGRHDIQVSLRVLQGAEQQMIAAYDYSLPLNSELREMALTAAERQRRDAAPVGGLFGY